MTLTELTQAVYDITGRPDRVAETAQAIRAATLKCHQVDFWYKDIYETGISFTTAEYFQQFDYRTLIPLWRSLKYLRKYDAVGQLAGAFLEVITPTASLDMFGQNKEDVCYLAGAELDIRSSTQEQYFLLGVYLNPNITAAGYNSWIALDHPYAIVYEAASRVFKGIGKDDEAAQFKLDMQEQIAMISADSINPVGY